MEQTSPQNEMSEEALLNVLFNGTAFQSLTHSIMTWAPLL